jgi:hypothetical protein
MEKNKIDSALLDRARRVAAATGYSSVEEFIAHFENELKKHASV